MATFKSTSVTDLDALPPKMIDPSELKGKIRVGYGSFKTGAAGPAVGDIIYFSELPPLSRILGIYVNAQAMSTGAGTAGMDIGDDGDIDRYAAAFSVDAAVNAWVALRLEDANPQAKTLGMGFKVAEGSSASRRLRGTVTGEAWAANSRIDMFAIYAVE